MQVIPVHRNADSSRGKPTDYCTMDGDRFTPVSAFLTAVRTRASEFSFALLVPHYRFSR